jgi:hypothetical protein
MSDVADLDAFDSESTESDAYDVDVSGSIISSSSDEGPPLESSKRNRCADNDEESDYAPSDDHDSDDDGNFWLMRMSRKCARRAIDTTSTIATTTRPESSMDFYDNVSILVPASAPVIA